MPAEILRSAILALIPIIQLADIWNRYRLKSLLEPDFAAAVWSLA